MKLLEQVHQNDDNQSLRDLPGQDSEFVQLINRLIDLKRNEEELFRRLEEFQEVIAAMANLDFEQRLPVAEKDNVFNYIAISMNMLNEELGARVIPQNHFKALMETDSDAVILTDNNHVICYVNEKTCMLLQLNRKDLIAHPIEKILANSPDLELASLPKEIAADLLGSANRKIRVKVSVHPVEDKPAPGGYLLRIHSGNVPAEEEDDEEEITTRSRLTKRQAYTLMEAIEMMDVYSYWRYFVKEPENVRLTQKFELVDQFVHTRDIKVMAEQNQVKATTLSSNLKQAMKFLRNESVKERYLEWVDENTPLTTLTKRDLQELKEETEYMITAKLIEKLNKRKNQLKYSTKAELMEKSLKELALDKATITALHQLGLYKIADLRAWNIKTLAEQNHITRNHLESIKEGLRQVGCLYILKESMDE